MKNWERIERRIERIHSCLFPILMEIEEVQEELLFIETHGEVEGNERYNELKEAYLSLATTYNYLDNTYRKLEYEI